MIEFHFWDLRDEDDKWALPLWSYVATQTLKSVFVFEIDSTLLMRREFWNITVLNFSFYVIGEKSAAFS